MTVDGEVDQADVAAADSTLHHSARLLGTRPGRYLGQFPTTPPGTNHEMLRVMSSQLLGLVMAALPNMEHLSLQSSRSSVRIPATALEVAGFTGLHLKTLEVSSGPAANPQGRRMFNLYHEAVGVLEKAPKLCALNLHMCYSTGFTPSLRRWCLTSGWKPRLQPLRRRRHPRAPKQQRTPVVAPPERDPEIATPRLPQPS